ncbi:MAG: phosphopantetheine-binding protein [Thiobacillaceae bacterium]
MNLNRDEIKAEVRTKVIELAKNLGADAADITDDDIIPATGYMDSAAIMELIVWYEEKYQMPLAQEEINIDNLGSINAMADFVLRRKQGL